MEVTRFTVWDWEDIDTAGAFELVASFMGSHDGIAAVPWCSVTRAARTNAAVAAAGSKGATHRCRGWPKGSGAGEARSLARVQ